VGLNGSGGPSLGDEQLFAELYPSLRRFAMVIKPPELDADDLVQEAMVGALTVRGLGEFSDPGAYLRRTMLNLASNARRRLGRRRRAFSKVAIAASSESSYPSDLQDLLRLTPPQRAAVYLAVVEGQSYGAIADALGCSEAAARTRVSRALRLLRVEMTEEVHDA
jgi:RNA polymerase sigma factor (sigma-70 family)